MSYNILKKFSGSIISTLMSLRASEFGSRSQLPTINDHGWLNVAIIYPKTVIDILRYSGDDKEKTWKTLTCWYRSCDETYFVLHYYTNL